MATEQIAGLYVQNSAARFYSPSKNGGSCPCQADALSRQPGATKDQLQLSENARSAYLEEGFDPKKASEFADRFQEALAEFTKYAMKLNGFLGEAKGNHALMALHVLGEKSGIRMPPNVVENQDAILKAFQSAWGLGDDAGVEEIFSRMQRAFGGDQSFALSPSTGRSGAPEGPPVTTPDRPADFRHALEAFTNGLFAEKGIPRRPGDQDLHRVMELMADKLGLDGKGGSLPTQIARALGVQSGDSMEQLIASMARAFNL